MAELTPKTISELPSASSVGASNLFVLSNGTSSYKITGDKVINTSGSGYCQMPDGTLIQWGTTPVTFSNERQWGSLYIADASQINFPQNFVGAPTVTFGPGSINSLSIASANATTSYIGNLQAVRATAFGTLNYTIAWIAVGRWK